MTPAQFKAIREGAGLSASALAKYLRLAEPKTIYRYENGERKIPGPVAVLMEMIETGYVWW